MNININFTNGMGYTEYASWMFLKLKCVQKAVIVKGLFVFLNIDLFLKSRLCDIVLKGSILFFNMFRWHIALLCVKDIVHNVLTQWYQSVVTSNFSHRSIYKAYFGNHCNSVIISVILNVGKIIFIENERIFLH